MMIEGVISGRSRTLDSFALMTPRGPTSQAGFDYSWTVGLRKERGGKKMRIGEDMKGEETREEKRMAQCILRLIGS